MISFVNRLKKLHDNRFISMYLFRYYKYNIYPKFTARPRIELLCVNKDGVKYEIVFKAAPTNIAFNNKDVVLKQYNRNRGFIWIDNTSGKLEIDDYQFKIKAQNHKSLDKQAVIIICDRIEKADDNGEFLYDWVLENKPEFTNVYFALSSDSEHFQRLQAQGYRLLDTKSKEFRIKYHNAEAIVSSVYSETLENHQQLRYKLGDHPTSKFICLQHGIDHNYTDEANINAHQKINYYITSIPFEKQLLNKSRIWFNSQTPMLGMSRFTKASDKTENKKIIYMPKWTAEAVNSSNVQQSKLYNSVKELTNSQLVKDYLQQNQLELKVVIHPQLGAKTKGFMNLASENIAVVSGAQISYRNELANCLLLVTDHSSVFFDALFYQKPIIFFHPDKTIVPELSIYNEVGKVAENSEMLVDWLETLKKVDYQVPINPKFIVQDCQEINQKIWELIING
ncbi:CDP-glycerol glycerophosphotransferase family protein [Mollicutes bacterium LVI A0039]|nr:CDP-glycerol glycerophosphotransferase family protein [Mollicutes bacterium LVI A0039]